MSDLSGKDLLADFERRREVALGMGGAERIARQHESGRLTARERLDALVDPGPTRRLPMPW